MNENTLKLILSFIFLAFISMPVFTFSLLDYEQGKKNELLEHQILEKELVKQKEKEQKIYLMGQFEPAERDDFLAVPAEYNVGEYKMYLKEETLEAFLKMREAAEKDKVDLKIASATRNFIYQKNIWNNKWNGIILVDGKNLSKSTPSGLERFQKILEYSAVPGTSRHHWGTDVDINDANPEYFDEEKGKKEYVWLVQNASKFNFCQPYNLKSSERSTGYNEEKWHWSYLPLAKTFTQEYKNLIKEKDIVGFSGDKYVLQLDLINNYVLGINPDCI